MSQVMVLMCPALNPDASCSLAPYGALYVPATYLTSYTWICAAAPQSGGLCGGYPPCTFMAVFSIPQGWCVDSAAADQTNQLWTSASNFTFGAANAYSPPFDVSQLDSVQVGQAFAAGFVLVATAWAIGKACALLLEIVKR